MPRFPWSSAALWLALLAGEVGFGMPSSNAVGRWSTGATQPCVQQRMVGGRAGSSRAEGWLGVLFDHQATELTIAEVIPGSPAELAGLRPGDVLLGFAGQPVPDLETLAESLAKRQPGTTVEIRIRRSDASQSLRVTLAERPNRGQ